MNPPNTPSVLVVSSNPRNLDVVGQVLETADHIAILVSNLRGLDLVLEKADATPGHTRLALIDLAGFDGSIWTRCERLRKAGIPLVVIGTRRSPELEIAGQQHGATSVLVKPVAVHELTNLIDLLMES